MARSAKANAISKKRTELREAYWPGEPAWAAEKPFFQAPRTLPMILTLLGTKKVSGNLDPRLVYVELFARHMGDGIIELSHEEDHAYAAGYTGTSAVRRWRERIQVLQKRGFIRTRGSGLRAFTHVLLRPPAIVVEELRMAGLVEDAWYKAYQDLQLRYGEPLAVSEEQKKRAAATVPRSPFDSDDDDLPF